MKAHAEITDRFAAAFAHESGPARCRDPRHCKECEEADQMLLDLDPRDLNFDDLSNESRNWIFSFATDESIRWLTPGFVRVALEASPPQPLVFFDRISRRASGVFSDEQWSVVLKFADDCCALGWVERADLGPLGPGTHRSNESTDTGKPDPGIT